MGNKFVTNELYVPIALESIEPLIFPDVALYINTGSNFVLYKSNGRDFSSGDHDRLAKSGVGFVYVAKEDVDIINKHMEANAERLLRSDALTNQAKGKMIYQTSINYVGDVFSNPAKSSDLSRTHRLVENLMLYISDNPDAITSLECVMSHNYHTFVHSLQVTALTLMIHAEAYALSRDEMLDVGAGALLHDFGKIFVPNEILNKTGRLKDFEIAILKRHPEDGFNFLKDKGNLSPVSLQIVRLHHERCNGSGYPLKLENFDIPRSAQITGVADVFCILTTDNNGARLMAPHMAVQIMRNEMTGSFAPQYLDILEKIVCTEEFQQMVL